MKIGSIEKNVKYQKVTQSRLGEILADKRNTTYKKIIKSLKSGTPQSRQAELDLRHRLVMLNVCDSLQFESRELLKKVKEATSKKEKEVIIERLQQIAKDLKVRLKGLWLNRRIINESMEDLAKTIAKLPR